MTFINCFGLAVLERGYNLVPFPPANINAYNKSVHSNRLLYSLYESGVVPATVLKLILALESFVERTSITVNLSPYCSDHLLCWRFSYIIKEAAEFLDFSCFLIFCNIDI
jgi:hypothetical protein